MGWEMRNEDAPNTVVHPEDLAEALAKLHARPEPHSPVSESRPSSVTRRRTGSTLVVYHPEDHGDSPQLPAISVEDTTETPEEPITLDPMEGVEGAIASEKAMGRNVSTARPPVEFMH